MKKLVPSLGVGDIDRSLEFYRRNFGFEAVSTFEDGDRLVWCCLRSGDTELMLQQLDPASPASPPGAERPSWVLYLSPPDIRTLHRRLLENGVPVGPLERTDYGAEECFVRDPDGYELWLSAPA